MISFVVALMGMSDAFAQSTDTDTDDSPTEVIITDEPMNPTEGSTESSGGVVWSSSADPRICFPIVTGQRRFRCGDNSGRIWGILGTGPSLRKVLASHPDSKRQLILADALRITGTALNATTIVVSGIVLYRVIDSAVTGQPQVSISIGEVIVLLGGSLIGSVVNRAATVELENALDAYNLADSRPLRLGVTPGAIVAADGKIVPTLGAQLRF